MKIYKKENLANGFIRPSKSPARTSILLVKEKNRSLRLCVDYQGLNNIIIKNKYLLPLIGEFLDRLGCTKRFMQMDLTNVYHQIQIHKGDEWKTTFQTKYDHYKYQVMSFGLTHIFDSFQGYINKILAKKFDVFPIIYSDSILIYTEDPCQPNDNTVRWVLKKFQQNAFFANLNKYHFHQEQIRFLRYVL